MKKTKNNDIDKESFINILKSMSVKEMQALIENKGKEPKIFNPLIHIRRNINEHS